ncbi:Gfo/Idh/MocA family oxidoreductase [Mycobacterium sp. CPCC 205372]|uniref:Gfo/Idh/MocA family oxidoreductase n=1 Tax=Mycobacterium hippophais TaxID=3016340 RepID=A0ABT4PU72_9MYCO|nr:Gfo/Idh/MocA family oxidoreductase [Mycobacterium hippophais]MCZ8380086.1 Gfo/Idh/MocA family oxidoreductase [Mycobacterium hippophais]
MDRCNVGFVGAGGVAVRHAHHLAQLRDVRIVAVTDPVPAAAQSFADVTGAAVVPDLQALLNTSPDAVYVCVPPHAHGAIEEQVLGAGIAMFVEKPLALDLPTAERIADAARMAGVVTAVGHHWRYSAAVDLVRELLDGRPVRLAVGSWIDRVPPVPWWSRRAMSGGQIVEQAAHVLDLIRLFCGDVVEVNAYANATPPGVPDADVDGATVAILRFDSGAVGTVAAACCLDWKHRAGLELHADGLSVTVHEDEIVARTDRGVVRRSLHPDDAKRAADRAFIDAVLDNGAARGGILVDYGEALRTHELACAIAASARDCRTVKLHD